MFRKFAALLSGSRSRRPAKPFRSTVRLQCEALEDRAVPAAGVTANLVGSFFFIDGDAGASSHDRISLTTDASGYIVVTGDGTAVNGGASASFSGVTNINIDTGDGNDHVTLNGVSVAGTGPFAPGLGNIVILTGSGNDRVDLVNVSASGFSFFAAGGDITVFTGDGNDVVNMESVSAFNTDNRGADLFVSLGDGNDQVTINNASANGQFVIGGGQGNDHTTVRNTSAGRFVIVGGPGTGPGFPTEELPGIDVYHDAGGNVGVFFTIIVQVDVIVD